MIIEIKPAAAYNIPAILELMRQFAEFENLLDHFEVTEDRLYEAMFGTRSYVSGLVALDGAQAVGYALYYLNFASFRGQRGVYLEDIYIDRKYRGTGVGKSILQHIARAAILDGCERIDFQVLNWNRSAIKFYELLGAIKDQDERHYKFTDDAFRSLAD